MKKIYRHSFTRDGHYIGCKEVTALDLIKPYVFFIVGLLSIVSFIYITVSDSNIRNYKERTPIALEVPSR